MTKKDVSILLGCIYKITSPSGKVYIGQTKNPYKRRHHYLKGDFRQQIKLWNDCKKNNWNPGNHFMVIEPCICGEDKDFINEREKYWIQYYDSFKNGLNCNEGGAGNPGYIFSEETRKKMSKSQTGIKHSAERNKHKSEYTKGRKHTEEAKKKMSEVKRSRMNDEIKDKIRKGLTGNKNGIGNKGQSKKVLHVNENKEYDSIKEAHLKTGFSYASIQLICKGKKEHIRGHYFRYL